MHAPLFLLLYAMLRAILPVRRSVIDKFLFIQVYPMYVSHIIRTCLDHNRTNRNMCVLHRISWSFLLLRNINKNYGVEFVVYLALCVSTDRKCCCSYLNETVYFRLIFSIFQTRFLIILAFHQSSFIIVVRCFCQFCFSIFAFRCRK